MSNKIIGFLEYYLPFINWLIIIFVFSHIPQLQSPLPGTYGYLFRKTAHFIEYFILSYLNYRLLTKYHKLNLNLSLIITFIFCSAYAVADEYHQTFIYGRNSSLWDVLIDTLGISTFIFGIFLYKSLKRNKKSRV